MRIVLEAPFRWRGGEPSWLGAARSMGGRWRRVGDKSAVNTNAGASNNQRPEPVRVKGWSG